MPDLLIDDIDEQHVEALREIAKAHNRSLEDEVKAILESVAAKSRKERKLPPDLARLQAELARRPSSSDSTEMVRAMRDAC